jgi:drug/metabolite transporter (DMT)-like permease
MLASIGGLALTADIPLIRLADGEVWSVVALRSGTTLAATAIIWLVWRWLGTGVPSLVPGRAGLAVVVCYALSALFFMLAVFNTSTANLVFILALNSMISALLAWLFLGERPKPATFVAMAAMLAGVALIVGDGMGSGGLLGDVLALCCTISIATGITITRASGKDMGFASLVAVALPCAVAVVMILGAGEGFRVAEPFWLVLNGAVVMPISFFCLANAPRYISGPEVAMFYLLETVLAPVWVWMLFSEAPTTQSLAGGAILVAAPVAHASWQLHQGRRRRATVAVRHPM